MIRLPKKSFGETFDAATVAGYVGPGFHNWPPGHTPQDTAPNPLLRIRSPAKKTFGAATGVSDPRLQKSQTQNNGAGGHAAHTPSSTGATAPPLTHTTVAFDRDLRRRNATPNTNTNDGIHIRGSGTAVTAVWPAKIDSPAIVLIAAEFNVSKPPL